MKMHPSISVRKYTTEYNMLSKLIADAQNDKLCDAMLKVSAVNIVHNVSADQRESTVAMSSPDETAIKQIASVEVESVSVDLLQNHKKYYTWLEECWFG